MKDMILAGPADKRMSSLEIAEIVESRHDKVKQSIERLANRAVIELPPMGEVKNHLGQTVAVYWLDKRSSLIVVAQLSPEFTARVVDRWQELEAQAAAPQFTLPANFAEALRALACEIEMKELVISQRDQAIKTKAEIGSRREATAMNTAAQAVKKATKLEQELDRAKEYVSVKRMSLIWHDQQFDWRLLKSTAKEMGIPSVDVFDQNYGSVKAYHKDVWWEAYRISADPEEFGEVVNQ